MNLTNEEWWKLSEPQRVIRILQAVGVARLANFDGCICSRFSIRDVDVEISCGKGQERGIWVLSQSMDYSDFGDGEKLDDIAKEIHRQVEGSDMRGSITVHIGKNRQS